MNDPAHVAAISGLLQPGDFLKLCVSVHVPQRAVGALLALVTHLVDNAREEAALFLLRTDAAKPVLLSTCPIARDLTVRSEQVPSSPNGSSPLLVHFRGEKAELSVIAQPGELRDLLAETRRLIGVAATAPQKSSNGNQHAWLDAYPVTTIDVRIPSPTISMPASAKGSASATSPSIASAKDALAAVGALSIESVRDEWVVRRLAARLAEFSTTSQVKIWLGTYNVADTIATEPLDKWLQAASDADLVVAGLQEVDMRGQNLLSGRVSVSREAAWATALSKALSQLPGDGWVKLASLSLGSVAIHAFARQELAAHCQVTSCAVPVGVGNLANKGAAALRIRCRDSVFAFVNAHLSAFEFNLERRNRELELIIAKMVFQPFASIEAYVPRLQLPPVSNPSLVGLSRSHGVWVFGDLNYRITMNSAVVKRFVADEEWKALWSSDQLQKEQAAKRALAGFEDGLPRFPHAPSYKYNTGKPFGTKTLYDTSEKQRTPAWTDRILWLSKASTVRQTSLACHADYNASDHKPLSSLFEVDVIQIDEAKRKEARVLVLKELDTFENDSMPNVDIAPSNETLFTTLRYDEPQTRSVTVTNTGAVLAEYSFIVKPDTGAVCKPWLDISPQAGLILPGESETIALTARVDRTNAAALNFADDDISDVFILSLSNGRDVFLSVTAPSYRPTCFGNSLERLVRLDEPIRQCSTQKRARIAEEARAHFFAEVKVPTAISRLTDWLSANAMQSDLLFQQPGDPLLVAQVRTCLDTGDDFPSSLMPSSRARSSSSAVTPTTESFGDLSDEGALIQAADADLVAAQIGLISVGDCLLQLLESLTQAVVPNELHAAAIAAGASRKRDAAYRVAASLPPAHSGVFTHCMAFLKAFLDRNGREPLIGRVAAIWAKVLLQPPGDQSSSRLDAMQRFIELFLADE